ncbi:large-conductance mechanosensitive channel protein MscL [Flavonifractor sp. An82]|uniref:large-conductance mechanosensitive channel protein MscL n=1 Tax=Flavonifractor sp. An82 TaxID=1965660 RepID=UPI000B39845D|nr:large-conductance mechanosensitive channel protein MscL [Flavonifractor sp. An82]OUN22834.1 large-conductance mechanosensitive channel [Flavonifractor sp. An82]
MSAKEKTKGFLAEFRKFIARGNVMDLAVGVIIGGAFKTIVDSLTNDILMPFVGIFIGESTFAALSFQVGGATIAFGSFIQAVVNFLIMAFVIFCLVKGINRFHRKKEEAAETAPAQPVLTTQEQLLTEIRDLLKEQHHE